MPPSPLSSCPSSPHCQTSPLPSTSRQKPVTLDLASSPKPSSPSLATSQKKARSYIGQLQHKTSTSAKVAPQQKQRKRRATPIFSSDEPEEDELAKENKASEPEPESDQSDKEDDKSDKGGEEESEEDEEGEKASCQPKDIEEEEEVHQKEQVDEEGGKKPEGEMEKEDTSEDEGADEEGEKGKSKEVACQQEGAPEPMDEDKEEHAGGKEAEKVAQQQKDMSEGEGDKEGQEKEVTKKRPVSTEGGASKRAKFDPPAPSAQQQTQESYAGEATQEPIYSIDELKKAESPHCIPYMDWSMPEEDIREYLNSFINDKRIPAQTLFNLFQTSIKLYNVGGGSRKLGIWDYDPETPRENLTIEHIFNGTNMMFNPEEIGGRTSATYPSEKEDVEMRDLDSSSAGGLEGGEEMGSK
ncbi:hypothetical protein EDB86DRAFT_3112403 [Lactarius hatsudake]|nr:hypothetical protein EDB86DRAFT_3112403 [Lactarius hatsudake]